VAELTLFGYRAAPSVVHRLDARLKLAAMAVLSLLTLNAAPAALALAALAVSGTLVLMRFPIFRFFLEFRWFIFILACLCLIRGVVTPGETLLTGTIVPLSAEGLRSGALFSGRLILIVWIGLILSTTTPANRLRAAMEWYLAPFPFLPRRKIGLLVGLLMRFIPLILNQSRAIGEAQRARGVENRKNPAYRVAVFSMTLMRVTFSSADHLAMAMEARCYTGQKSASAWKFQMRDLWAFLMLILVGGGMIILSKT